MIDAPATLRELAGLDPYDNYEAIRRQGPVYWDAGMHAWLVTGYEDCAFVERREDLFAAATGTLTGWQEIGGRRGILTIDGEAHKALHRHMTRYLSSDKVEEYRGRLIRPLVEGRIDAFAPRGRVEIGAEFADHVPVSVVAAVLGIATDDDRLLAQSKRWMDQVLAWRHTYGDVPELVEGARRATRDLEALLRPVVQERRTNPRDDYISALWEVGPTIFDDWGDDDVLAQCKVLFEAGTETTTHLLCTLTYLLVTREGLRAQVAADRAALLPRFVDETLRAITVTHIRVRVATRDVKLAGTLIRHGDRVHPINAAANRDPEHYSEPAQLDLHRRAFRNHLAFNVGPRHCVGAGLARAEAHEAMDALLTRLPNPRLDPTAEAPHYAGFVNRSFRPLHLRFDPQPAA
ncbi:MAG: cytochrome P450 [Chloroflexi bacterium]|nr:cytochrome P450 [Chloroflexota bacterium]